MRGPIVSALCRPAEKATRTDRFHTRDIMEPAPGRSGSSGAVRVTIKNFPGTARSTGKRQAAGPRKDSSHTLNANAPKSLSAGEVTGCLVFLFCVSRTLFYSPTIAVSCEDET